MTKAEQIAEMFGNDGQCFIARGEYLSESRRIDELCDLRCVRKERGRAWYASDTGELTEYEACSDGDLIRYEFHDGSAIVIATAAWDIEGDTKFSWESNDG